MSIEPYALWRLRSLLAGSCAPCGRNARRTPKSSSSVHTKNQLYEAVIHKVTASLHQWLAWSASVSARDHIRKVIKSIWITSAVYCMVVCFFFFLFPCFARCCYISRACLFDCSVFLWIAYTQTRGGGDDGDLGSFQCTLHRMYEYLCVRRRWAFLVLISQVHTIAGTTWCSRVSIQNVCGFFLKKH